MKNYLLIFFTLYVTSTSLFSQGEIFVNYTLSQDKFYKDRLPLGVEFGYNFKINNKLSLYSALGSKYVLRYNTKTPSYNSYEINELEPETLWFVEQEKFLTREFKQNSFLLIPTIDIRYEIFSKKDLIRVSLFSGINTSVKVFDKYFWSYVFYTEDLTEYRLEDRDSFEKRNVYGVYIPVGISFQLHELPFSLSASYLISIKKKGIDNSWNPKRSHGNNFEFGIGYTFNKSTPR